MTVLGPVDPVVLGAALVHEHLFIDLRHASFVPPPEGLGWISEAQVGLVDPLVLARHSCSIRDNLVLDDLDVAVAELQAFAAAGGGCLVDVSPPDIGRSPTCSPRRRAEAGSPSSWAAAITARSPTRSRSASVAKTELTQEIVQELTEGVGSDRIRPGIIGEIGVNGEERGTRRLLGEMTETERRVLRAGARAAHLTGAPMTIHLPARDSAVPAVLDELDGGRRSARADLAQPHGHDRGRGPPRGSARPRCVDPVRLLRHGASERLVHRSRGRTTLRLARPPARDRAPRARSRLA